MYTPKCCVLKCFGKVIGLKINLCFRMGLFTVNVSDVRYFVINLDQGQKPKSVLVNSLVLICCVSRFYSLELSFPIFRKSFLG